MTAGVAAGMVPTGVHLDANAEALRLALTRQHHALASVANGLERASRDRIPAVDETQWVGPARLGYDIALGVLRTTLARTMSDVSLAQSATTMALTTLAGRVR